MTHRICKGQCFDMVTGINESKTLTKHTSCECKCEVWR